MAKGKLPPQLMAYWEKKNKQQDNEDSKTEEGKERLRGRKASFAVKAAAEYKKSKSEKPGKSENNQEASETKF